MKSAGVVKTTRVSPEQGNFECLAANLPPGRQPFERQFVIPPWADRIEVESFDHHLAVTGIGTCFDPIEAETVDDRDWDLLRAFDAGRRAPRDRSRMVPHLLFARAQTPDLQVDFVRQFGPVLSNSVSYTPEFDGLVARQDIAILDWEQKLFSGMFEMIQILRTLDKWSKRIGEAIRRYNSYYLSLDDSGLPSGEVDRILQMQPDPDHFLLRHGRFPPETQQHIQRLWKTVFAVQGLIDSYPSDIRWNMEGDLMNLPRPFRWDTDVGLGSFAKPGRIDHGFLSVNVIVLANLLLCRTFNQFPVKLYYANGVLQGLPSSAPSGVRPLLYYMLRMEYLYKREIRLCARPTCGFYFVPDRPDGVWCSESCENREKARRHRAKSRKDLRAACSVR